MLKSTVKSTFAERLEYSRDRQRILGSWEADGVLAEYLGVSKASVSDYKKSETAPAAERTLAIAQWVGVDPGWLAFGAESAAPAPEGFELWLVGRRKRSPQPAEQPAAEPGAAINRRRKPAEQFLAEEEEAKQKAAQGAARGKRKDPG